MPINHLPWSVGAVVVPLSVGVMDVMEKGEERKMDEE